MEWVESLLEWVEIWISMGFDKIDKIYNPDTYFGEKIVKTLKFG